MNPPAVLDPGAGLTQRLLQLPDGRRLRAVLAGDGPGPMVVFEAGLGAAASSWVHTQREIAGATRTLAYDRSGFGGSDPDRQPRTLDRLADDLDQLLDALGETDPVVLVGHSWGGPILRCFADRRPERVAGLVFVDPTVAEAMGPWLGRLNQATFWVLAGIARLRGGRLPTRLIIPSGLSPELSRADLAIIARDLTSTAALRTARQEATQIGPMLPVVRRLQEQGTPVVPTVSIQGGRIDRGMATFRARLNRVAAELMAAVPDGRVVVVPEAGHLVPQEAPGVVRDTILTVLDAVR